MNRKEQLERVHNLAEEIRQLVRNAGDTILIKELKSLLDMEIKVAKSDLYLDDDSAKGLTFGDEVAKSIKAVLDAE